jgi:hypothetical protein
MLRSMDDTSLPKRAAGCMPTENRQYTADAQGGALDPDGPK